MRKEDNPCSLCAKMPRALCNRASGRGITKLALSASLDDMVETFLLAQVRGAHQLLSQPVTH